MQKSEFQKYQEEQARKNYSNEELVELAADKFADILVRHMDKEREKLSRISEKIVLDKRGIDKSKK